MAMPAALSEDLVRHVVSFVSDRQVRLLMGYDVDACIKWRILPPPLFVHASFAEQLGELRRDWLSSNGVKTITPEDVMIRSVFMHWGDHPGFVMHSVCYRAEFNPKVWRVDRVVRYYRYGTNQVDAPACIITVCEGRCSFNF